MRGGLWVVGAGMWEVGGRWWGVRVHTFQKLESLYFFKTEIIHFQNWNRHTSINWNRHTLETHPSPDAQILARMWNPEFKHKCSHPSLDAGILAWIAKS